MAHGTGVWLISCPVEKPPFFHFESPKTKCERVALIHSQLITSWRILASQLTALAAAWVTFTTTLAVVFRGQCVERSQVLALRLTSIHCLNAANIFAST